MSQIAPGSFEPAVQAYIRIREHNLGKRNTLPPKSWSCQRHQQALDRLLTGRQGGQSRVDGRAAGEAEGLETGGAESNLDPAPDGGLAGHYLS